MRLDADRVLAITGASRGIGRAVARELAACRTRLALLARSAEALAGLETELRRLGAADVFRQAGDVGDPAVTEAWLTEILNRWGRVDALINNAGVGIIKPVEALTDDDIERTLLTNLIGPLRLMRAAIPLMRRQGSGHIVNISSIAGEVGFAGGGAYCASKFGLQGLSECLMAEVRRDGLKVSLVCPGSVDTRFDAARPGEDASWKIPPEEIARTIRFLLESPDRVMASKIHLRPTLQGKP